MQTWSRKPPGGAGSRQGPAGNDISEEGLSLAHRPPQVSWPQGSGQSHIDLIMLPSQFFLGAMSQWAMECGAWQLSLPGFQCVGKGHTAWGQGRKAPLADGTVSEER